MRCEEIQKHLAHPPIDAQPSRLPASVRAHLQECPACRQAQAIYAGIDRELREHPAWQPPSGFAERVSRQGLALISEAPARPRSFFARIPNPAFQVASLPILLGLLAAAFCFMVLMNMNVLATAYPDLVVAFSRTMLANAGQLAWITGILSVCFSAWITRRVLQ